MIVEEDAAVDPLSAWHTEHMRFRRLLDYLEQQMAAFRAGEDPDYDLMRDVVHYLHHYADRFHHPREDVAFERLAQRDPGCGLQVKKLSQEHRAIDVAGEALLKHLEDILEGVMTERATVEAAAALYLVYFRQHIATEENMILQRAAKILTREDWAAVAAAVPEVPDPLFGEDVDARYRELYQQITRTA